MSLTDEEIARLTEDGSISEIYLEQDGEFSMEFDMDKLSTLHPSIYRKVTQFELSQLWVDMPMYVERVIDNGNPMFRLTEAGKEYLDSQDL